jgi:hypothetical protein
MLADGNALVLIRLHRAAHSNDSELAHREQQVYTARSSRSKLIGECSLTQSWQVSSLTCREASGKSGKPFTDAAKLSYLRVMSHLYS